MTYRSEFARIFEVFGERARAYVTLAPADSFEVRGGNHHRIGVVGQHVVVPLGSTRLVARINAITANDPNFRILESTTLPNFPVLLRILDLDFVGTIETRQGKLVFDKGVNSYPTADSPVFTILDEELRLLFLGEEGRDSIPVGDLTESESEKVYIDVERLFQGHFGVLGSTGSGKTCTLVHLLQSIIANIQFKSPHFLVLDPHGEYARAFDNDAFAEKALLLRINCDEPNVSKLASIQTDLPHYFFGFGEYRTLYRPAPQTQEPNLREAIGRVRREANRLSGNEHENTVVADRPLKFDIDNLHRDIFNKNKDPNGGGFLGSLGYRVKVLAAQPELKFLFHPTKGILEYDDLLRALLGFDRSGKFFPITIVDLSRVPRILNLLTIITNLLARMVYDFLRLKNERGNRHCCIVLEEAHNYIPRKFNLHDKSEDHDFTLSTFETIAREGRKYGTCLAISSQRPRDLSETVVSQCGSFFIHRLSNLGDKDIIRSAASNVEVGLLERMAVLGRQICVVMGDAIKSAAEVRVAALEHEPDSSSARISEIWRNAPLAVGSISGDDLTSSGISSEDDVPF